MRRREFITLLGGAAAWPLAARAQQPSIPIVGFFSTATDARSDLFVAFRRALEDGGYVVGRNVAIEYRFADGQYDRLPALAHLPSRSMPHKAVARNKGPNRRRG